MKNFSANVSETFSLDKMANLPISETFLLNSETFSLNEILCGSVKILSRLNKMDGGSVKILCGSVDGTFLLNEILFRVDSERFLLDDGKFLVDEIFSQVNDFFLGVDEKVFGVNEMKFGIDEIKFGVNEKVFGEVETNVLLNEIVFVNDDRSSFCDDFFSFVDDEKFCVAKKLSFGYNGSFLVMILKKSVNDLLVKVVIFLICDVEIFRRVYEVEISFDNFLDFIVSATAGAASIENFTAVGNGLLMSESFQLTCEGESRTVPKKNAVSEARGAVSERALLTCESRKGVAKEDFYID